MKTVKILLALVLAMSMFLCLAACSGEEQKSTEPATTAAPAETTEAPVETTEAVTGPATVPEETNPVYKVTVVDEGGNPVAGAMVQLCDVNAACYPNVTNEEGVATYSLTEAEYKASFTKIPEGYELPEGETEFYFDEGSFEITLTLKAVA